MESERAADLIRVQLRRQRALAGMSQEEFGRRTNYSASTVSAVETGTRMTDRRTRVGRTISWRPAASSSRCCGWRTGTSSRPGSSPGWRPRRSRGNSATFTRI